MDRNRCPRFTVARIATYAGFCRIATEPEEGFAESSLHCTMVQDIRTPILDRTQSAAFTDDGSETAVSYIKGVLA